MSMHRICCCSRGPWYKLWNPCSDSVDFYALVSTFPATSNVDIAGVCYRRGSSVTTLPMGATVLDPPFTYPSPNCFTPRFQLGPSGTIVMPCTGTLTFVFNDSLGDFADNSGSFNISMTGPGGAAGPYVLNSASSNGNNGTPLAGPAVIQGESWDYTIPDCVQIDPSPALSVLADGTLYTGSVSCAGTPASPSAAFQPGYQFAGLDWFGNTFMRYSVCAYIAAKATP